MQIYTIISDSITIGFFSDEESRDDAFHKYFVENMKYEGNKLIKNNVRRWGMKSTREAENV